MFAPCQSSLTDNKCAMGTKGWLSSVSISFLIVIIIIILAAISNFLVHSDYNAQAFTVFIALSMASIFLSFRFPNILSFHRVSLSIVAIAILASVAMRLIPGDSGSNYLAPFLAYSLFGKFIFIIFVCFLLPVIEEIYFRGLLYPIISRNIGYKTGVIITLTLFTLIHCPSLNEILPIALLGALCTWLVHRSGSVIPGILAHSAGNCVWLIIALRFP
jgi:membrane protease YdiL (CAAX protease family)